MATPNDGIIAAYADTMQLAGGTMTGPIAMGSNKITGLAAGSAPTDAAQIQQAADQAEYYLNGAPTFLRYNMPRRTAASNLSALTTQVMTSAAITAPSTIASPTTVGTVPYVIIT